jgi:hypothetical protein
MMAGALQVSTISGASSTHVRSLKFGKMNSWLVNVEEKLTFVHKYVAKLWATLSARDL